MLHLPRINIDNHVESLTILCKYISKKHVINLCFIRWPIILNTQTFLKVFLIHITSLMKTLHYFEAIDQHCSLYMLLRLNFVLGSSGFRFAFLITDSKASRWWRNTKSKCEERGVDERGKALKICEW